MDNHSQKVTGNDVQGLTPIKSLIEYTLHLADTNLILGHRNSEWTGHGPVLEQDIAISNIALDLIGQARNFYQYAATLINQNPASFPLDFNFDRPVTEDDLAYLRDAFDYKNHLLTEQLNGDWAHTILRQFYFSVWQYLFYSQLIKSSDQQLSAIAEKSLKETTYHVRWSSEWVIRLGDGTQESQQRMFEAISNLQNFYGEFFEPAPYENDLLQAGISVDVKKLKADWDKKVNEIFEEATLPFTPAKWSQAGGKTGIHTEHLGFILAEMQFLQRAYPNSIW